MWDGPPLHFHVTDSGAVPSHCADSVTPLASCAHAFVIAVRKVASMSVEVWQVCATACRGDSARIRSAMQHKEALKHRDAGPIASNLLELRIAEPRRNATARQCHL